MLIINVINTRAELIKIELGNPDNIRPKIALALSGGASRGMAHIAVLKEFERNNIKFDYIVGTSIGALLGGLYASGYSADELDSIVAETKWDEFKAIGRDYNRSELFYDQKQITDRSILSFRFNNFNFVVPEAISIGTKYIYFLNSVLWNAPYQPVASFDDLKYKFRAVATDILRGESISFKGGNIATIIRASSTLPLQFSPVRYDNKILVDGGILANIPAEQTREFNPDYTIAVDVTTPLLIKEELNKPWNVADQVVSIQMKKAEQVSAKYADVIITPHLKNIRNSDFSMKDSALTAGREGTIEKLPQILTYIQKYRDSVFAHELLPLRNINFDTISITSSGLSSSDEVRFRAMGINSFSNLLSFLATLNNYKELNLIYNSEINQLLIKTKTFPKINAIIAKSSDDIIQEYIQDSINTIIRSGQFDESNSELLKEKMLKLLNARAYNLSSVKLSLSNDTIIAEINTPILSTIYITGNNSVSSELIRRNFRLKEGDYLSAEKLTRSWEDIFNTNLFSSVDIQVQKNIYQNNANVFISVKEIGSQKVNLGVRIDEAMKTRLGVDLIEENFANFGTRLNLRFVGGEREILTNFSYEQPRLLNSLFTYKAEGYYHFRRAFDYKLIDDFAAHDFFYVPTAEVASQVYGLKFFFGIQIQKTGRIAVEGRYERQRKYDWEVFDGNKPLYKSINTIKFDAIFDTEDQHYFPTNGYLVNMFLETNLFNVNDNIAFSKAVVKYKTNHSINNFTFSPALSFGFSDKTTPYLEFFDLSGNDGFYGLLLDQEKGRQLVKAQFELRYKPYFIKLFFDTYFSIRYDIGSVWIVPEQIKFSSLKHGLGASVQFDTPIGPAKFSVGNSYKFTKDPNTMIIGPLAFYYSIGISL